MTPQQFEALVKAKQREIHNAIHRVLPVKIGRIATDHFQENFRHGGFVDGGLHPWPITRRQQNSAPGGSAAGKYGPLMSARKNLYGSIRYVPGDARVVIGTTVHYAAVHNEGATIISHPRVKPKMRKFAWRQFFAAGGKDAPADSGAGFWKGLALTKKEKLTVTSKIPQRKFIGDSQELNQKIGQTIDNELRNILKS